MHVLIFFILPATISFAALFFLLVAYGDRHHDLFQMMIIALNAFTNLGYLAIAFSNNLETALLANKIAYLGGVWIPLCVIMMLIKLCNLKIPHAVTAILGFFNLFVYIIALFVGHFHLFYTSAYIKTAHGVTVLKLTYGPLHNLFYIMLILETLFAFAIVIYASFVQHKGIPLKSVWLTFFAMLAPRAVYIVRLAFDFDVTFMPILYAISSLLFLIAYSEINLHDIALIVASTSNISNDHGYIAFDSKKRLMSFNTQATEFFPELSKSSIDKPIDETTLLYSEIVTKLDLPESFKNEIGIQNKIFLKVNIIPPVKTGFLPHVRHLAELTYLVELIDNTFEHNYMSLQKDFSSTLQNEVYKQVEHIKAVYDSVISSMSLIIANRDDSTGGHVERTSISIKIFLQALQNSGEFHISPIFSKNIEKAATLHDIGKIAVDDAILRKPGKFTQEEYELMKSHPARGAEIIERVLSETDDADFKRVAVNMAHYHHERWDGTGYPNGLRGSEIPLEARIMALPDVFDALVSARAYKEAFSYDAAFEIINNSIGTHFEPALGKIFLSLRDELEQLYNTIEM